MPTGAELRHSLTISPRRKGSPLGSLTLPAWPGLPPPPWWRVPVDDTLPASSHPALIAYRSLSQRAGAYGSGRGDMVQSWDTGILAWGRLKHLSLHALSRDWGRGSRDSHPCLLFSHRASLPQCKQSLGPTSVRPSENSEAGNVYFPSHASPSPGLCLSLLLSFSIASSKPSA